MRKNYSWGEQRPESESPKQQKIRRWRRLRSRLVVAFLLGLALFGGWWYMFAMPGQSFRAAEVADATGEPVSSSDPLVASRSETQDAPKVGAGMADSKSGKPEKELSEELSDHVVHLAETIGERNLKKYKNLCEAAKYLKTQLTELEYKVSEQKFRVRGLDCFNIIAEKKGTSRPEEILIVGAHYDSVAGSPGANDNGTGVAAMLALAKRFSKSKLDRTIRFVGFTNEEPPYFQNPGEMGSSVYARKCRAADENIVGVLSLETMGYFSDAEDSQKYPAPLNLMYPSTGNFIGFVGNLESREFLHRVVKTFREHAKIPSEAACLPSVVQGVGWSDHWSFWQEDYVGIMVTDTAPFRYPHYHLITDTPNQLDFKSLAKVVEGLEHAVKDLAKVKPESEPKKEGE